MREIKFKAWDVEKKRIVDVIEIDFTGSGSATIQWDKNQYIESLVNIEQRLELVQFTGLKDKNGKEIYFDFDIVSDGVIQTIVKWNSWKLLDDIENGVSNWKIIGNIYKNPELIE